MQQVKVKKGDTIVEALFAFAVFGMVAVSSIQIMQRGILITQTALEINLVRSQMNSQAEALRFLNARHLQRLARGEAADPKWNQITSESSSPANFSKLTANNKCQPVSAINGKAFILGVRSNDVDILTGNKLGLAKTFSRLTYPSNADSNVVDEGVGVLSGSEGLWVEATAATDKSYYDFHIRACWPAPSGDAPTTLDTLVRLYVPKN